MSMSWWWIAFAVVVLLALVAAVADGRGRGGRGPGGRRGGAAGTRAAGRPGGRTRPPAGPGRGPEPGRAPRPGEIWWAEVPYEDGPGAKDRPCLVLRVRGGSALVVKITSKNHADRPGVIALPAGTVGDERGRASFLETDELREVAVRVFRRRVGVVAPEVWERVRGLG
ncbi:type II toxin-antitoxin system PemK/MazF family toxin [Streptomyces sp. NPDC014734]|uniref:type II toxin-antitoxin system PemK/MazF family toxin n=1 Tax=Streptomyces sp. NPDC014734 TaxID=3364886 RepID=UPI0036FF5B07